MTDRAEQIETILRAFRGAYDDEGALAKRRFHTAAKTLLRRVAVQGLHLKGGQFDLRTNLGGIAVLGETTLHTDELYIQIGHRTPLGTVLYRTCNGRNDYTGGPNQWCSVRDLCGRYHVKVD